MRSSIAARAAVYWASFGKLRIAISENARHALTRVADDNMMSRYPDVKCPTCKKLGPWLEESTGPFCGKRCKLVDLGKWFNGEMAIEEPLRGDHFEGYADLPPGSYLDQPE